jgi:hypothetical protein
MGLEAIRMGAEGNVSSGTNRFSLYCNLALSLPMTGARPSKQRHAARTFQPSNFQRDPDRIAPLYIFSSWQAFVTELLQLDSLSSYKILKEEEEVSAR